MWFNITAAVLPSIFVAVQMSGRAPATPYGRFLDQLPETSQAWGAEIHGCFKRPIGDTRAGDIAQRDAFRSRVPDFGDPMLIGAPRKQLVATDVTAPSPWAWLLGRIPWPMLVVLEVLLVAALARTLRGGQAGPGSAAPAMLAHGMPALLAGLFASQQPARCHP